jgi:hypothetical protein
VLWNSSFGTDLGGNKDVNPLFVTWIDPAAGAWAPTTGGDYHLNAGSPAINMGDNDLYLPTTSAGEAANFIADLTYLTGADKTNFIDILTAINIHDYLKLDAGGADRIKPGAGTIDMGAYEKQ